ncbi:MAG: methionyl-tRNA formyltransferase [Candidatus Peribacter riflensis]|uniref:Methionyl-tRNA formyltransferase n=1 Tax=Candidatus Peribacter riflensis TaxID=1735162 RepID=A0A0S1SVC7_9BACT|nr:MAG: methionyl-tRNA formyltransferase [Candidatus Peribacter riflensis]ALM11102.1 MAG: methionyl-tRNA formyltransferase [Candidatus Peribacter riflensis]ALM12205.1 MAG: methionyl-tRNA formyltransferase [Candidatus Peribacter riflensis]ALM13308.1 MAG: methionyl-tRNA formyltransferase [Candidatus Peribacter riflensis]ALM14408.1 MAG: methionyl-tRNA formyltransferase [Candidatus Peribacter riflensis]
MYTRAVTQQPLSIVFCGTPEFAVPSLTALLERPKDFRLSLVITQPDQPVGRKQALTPPPVKVYAEAHRLPLLQPDDINDAATHSRISALGCDVLVTVAYGQILSPALLLLPRLGGVNVHPSLLPKWRGAAPIQNAILASDSETGVTVQQMVQALDAGPILAQERMALSPEETQEHLSVLLSAMGAKLLADTLTKPFSPVPQDETHVTFCRKLSRKDGEVNPAEMSAEEIHRRVRALSPWPGITAPFGGTRVKILATSLVAEPEALEVPCKDGRPLFVLSLQPQGRKPMSGKAWLRGHNK